MDTKKLQEMINKTVYPGATVNSLVMVANRLHQKYGHEGLREFMAALCRQDIYKGLMTAQRLRPVCRHETEAYVLGLLAERCKNADEFSHLELLAIAVCKDVSLLQMVSPFLPKKVVDEAMHSADSIAACNLLQLGLTVLPEVSCEWVRKAFCKLLISEYNERMEKALTELMPCLLEHGAADVLSALVKIAGVERISGFYGEELPEELDRMILSGMDSIGVWELFFYRFFQWEHSQEELLNQGLWYVQLHVREPLYAQVCASFYLYVATRYGVDHPILNYMEVFFSSEDDDYRLEEDYRWYENDLLRYSLRYKEVIRPLWAEPGALLHFLEKTAPCNPFCRQRVQEKWYNLLQNAQDRTAYMRLQSLFETELPVADILTIFFSTDLRQRLPLEDVFYLARRYGVLSGLLEALRDRLFIGRVTGQEARWLFLSPDSYFLTAPHLIPITYKILENVGYDDQLKRQILQYTITGFFNGNIHVTVCGAAQLPDSEAEDPLDWEAATEQLRQRKALHQLSEKQMKGFDITEFTLDDVMEKSDLNLFTEVIMERTDCLEAFRKLLGQCKWNASFLKPELPLPKNIYKIRQKYQKKSEEMFRLLLENEQDIELVLQLYFFSIYRTIVPLNKLLQFAPRERLLEHLPKFAIYCRFMEKDSDDCAPINIMCAPMCVMEHTDGVSRTDSFAAVIRDIVVTGNCVSKILLEPFQMDDADIEERGALFGYLASNMRIKAKRRKRMATLPSAAECDERELRFNIRCMEEAVFLRRSNATALRHLIRVLGDANPFAFGVSYAAERFYLEKKKADTKNIAVSMVLNAYGIEDIRNFYLHTHIKFHLQLPGLAALIRERRADLEDGIPGMFEDVTFRAIADEQGNLWMPWVAQNTLRVSSEYAGKLLSCRVKLEKDGTVRIEVTEAVESDEFFELLNTCLLCGYQMDQNMEKLAGSLLAVRMVEQPQQQEKEQAEEQMPTFEVYCSQLKKRLYTDPFSHEDYAEGIQKLITDFKQAHKIMKRTMLDLIQEWLYIQPDREKIPPLLLKISICFVEEYTDDTICAELTKMLCEHFGIEQSHDFEVQLRDSISEWKKNNAVYQLESSVAQNSGVLNETTMETRGSLWRLTSLICFEHNRFSKDEMEAVVSKLTAQWMQTYEVDNSIIVEFQKMHQEFIQAYQSGELGLILIRQADQYMNDDEADKLDRLICKCTFQNFKDHPQLKQMLPPYEERIARLERRIDNPQCPINDIGKRINRVVKHYSSFISEAEMERMILKVIDRLMRTRADAFSMHPAVHGLSSVFESCYNSTNLGKILWQQRCRHLDRDSASSLHLSRPMTEQIYGEQIEIMISVFKAHISEAEMKQAVLKLVEQWLDGISDDMKAVQTLGKICRRFADAYDSGELASDLCLLAQRYLDRKAVGSLCMLIVKPDLLVGRNLPDWAKWVLSLDDWKEQLSQQLSEPDFQEKFFFNTLHNLIRSYAKLDRAEDIARTVAELVEQWLRRYTDEVSTSFYLFGIHDCFVKYCQTDHLAELLCRLLEQYQGENAANAFAERLHEPLRKLQKNTIPQ